MAPTTENLHVVVVHKHAVDTAAEIRRLLALNDSALTARARASIMPPVREGVLSVEFRASTVAELRNKVAAFAALVGVSSKVA